MKTQITSSERSAKHKKMNVNMDIEDIHRSHCLGRQRQQGKSRRPIIAQPASYRLKAKVMAASKTDLFLRKKQLKEARERGAQDKKMKNPAVNVREHLTWRRQQLMHQLIQQKKSRLIISIWTVDGVILYEKHQTLLLCA